LRPARAEDAGAGYNAMVAAYNIDLRPKPGRQENSFDPRPDQSQGSAIQTGNDHRRFLDPKDPSERLLNEE
jgi:hypothetical protein